MELSILIPCYNEQESIPNLVNNLKNLESSLKNKKIEYEVLFVDDGSTDKTLDVLKKYFKGRKNVKMIKHDVNGNVGKVFRTGLVNSLGKYIATYDADMPYDISSVEHMYEIATKNDYDIVTASPYHPNGGVSNIPKYRLLLSKSTSIIYKILLNSEINTFTAFTRVYKKESIKKISYKNNGFIFSTELIVKALLNGFRVAEYPTKLLPRKFGESKLRLFKVIGDHLKLMSKIALRTL